MQIRQMEISTQDWHRHRMPYRLSHLRKRLGISQIRRYLLRKRISSHRWTRNFGWWWPLHWSLPKSYRKSPFFHLQSPIRQQHLLRGMFVETQHGNPRFQKRQQTQRNPLRNCLKNRQSLVKNRRPRLGRSHLFVWRIIRGRSLSQFKRYELIIKH